MKETTITVGNTVGFYVGCTIKINDELYKVRSSTNTTLTIYKVNVLERFLGWLIFKVNDLKWKITGVYYDAADWIAEKIDVIRTR